MRSAKSVAWSKLNVVGVNIFFFLPRCMVSWTRGEEFHSLNATAISCERSQWLSRDIWVDLPEPSMPSTTISFPLKRLGTKREAGGGLPCVGEEPRLLIGKTLSAERLGAPVFGFLGGHLCGQRRHSHSLCNVNRKPLNAHLGQGLLFRSRWPFLVDLLSAYSKDILSI